MFSLGHGIGRSGDLKEIQPKAYGSSLIYHLTNKLIKTLTCNSCLILPMATGMTLLLCLLTIRKERPNSKYVIFLRVDQKSCFKCIVSAGFIPIIMDGLLNGDEITTDLPSLKDLLTHAKAQGNFNEKRFSHFKSIDGMSLTEIVCVLSNTSCFAPRGSDDIQSIGLLCKSYDIPHIVNNAYGLNSTAIISKIRKSILNGACIDCMIQSCDKNFMVPVGGAIAIDFTAAASPETPNTFCDKLAKTYPGRASITPSLDMFITLLSMGTAKYSSLLQEQSSNYVYFVDRLSQFALEHGERVLKTPNNPISIAMTLDKYYDLNPNVTEIGSMLFTRNVTGARVVVTGPSSVKVIEGYKFSGWASHCTDYNVCKAYLTVACTIGLTRSVIDNFLRKLTTVLKDYKKRFSPKTSTSTTCD